MFLFASSRFHLQEYYYDFVCASNHSYIIIPFTVRISKDGTVDHYVEKFDSCPSQQHDSDVYIT